MACSGRAGRTGTTGARAPAAAIVGFRFVVGLDGFADAAPAEHGVGNPRGEEPDRPQRVVVARDDEVDFVGIAVRVHDADDGNLQLPRFVDRDLFLAGVDDEERIGQARHVANAFEVLLKLLLFLFDLRDFLLGERVVAAVGFHRLEVAQPREAPLDRREVGQQPAEPTLVHEEHPAPLCFFRHRVLCLPLGAHKQDRPPFGREIHRELFRVAEELRCLRQVDDVDPVPLAEDVCLHLRVPAFRLVTEMDSRFEQILQRDAGQASSP